jgi:membrane carboxypeptidase/penicillin-binding protein
MTTTWIGDDLRERALGLKDAAYMLTVPMFARYINEVAAMQPLRDVPWERPPGVKKDDTGGTLRTTMDEVLAETDAAAAKGKPAPPKKPAPPVKAPAPR